MQVVSNTNTDRLNKVATPKRTFYLTGETTEIVDSWLRGNSIMLSVFCYNSSLNKCTVLICLLVFLLTIRLSDCLFLHPFVHSLAYAFILYSQNDSAIHY